MGLHTLEPVQRRRLRCSAHLVRISLKDQHGRLCQGKVLIVSGNEVVVFTEFPLRSDLVEIQPVNSELRIRVLAKYCHSVSSGYIVECAFATPVTTDMLEALYRAR